MYDNIQKYYPGFLFFAKFIIVVLAYRLVSERILEESSYQFFIDNLKEIELHAFPVVLVLMSMTLLNFFIEVIKWKSLVGLIERISLGEALKQSLTSLTVSLITPNRIGEYGAKALYFDRRERTRVVLYNFIGNFSQMSATLFFGSIGLWVVYEQLPSIDLSAFPWSGVGLLGATVITGGLLLGKLWKGFYSKLISKFREVPGSLQFKVFALSIFKYLVFSHQFYFLLLIFGVELNYFLCMSLISISYLISSLIPGFVIFDWLVKGSVAVFIFSRFGVPDLLVLSITSVMWLLNFGLPSLVGTLFVMAFKTTGLLAEKSSVRE